MSDYAYYNRNVMGNVENDCVTRAISLATKLPYLAVGRLLDMSAVYYDCDKLNCGCYGRLLSDIFNYPIRYSNYKETVADVIDKFPLNTLIIRIDGHLTSSVAGVLTDIFDCSNELVDKYWIVA